MPYDRTLADTKEDYMTYFLLTKEEHCNGQVLNLFHNITPEKKVEYLKTAIPYFTMEKETLLHLAAKTGNVELCTELLTSELNPFIRNQDGKTAFQLVLDDPTIRRRDELITLFLEQHTAIGIKGHLEDHPFRNLLLIGHVDCELSASLCDKV